MTRTRISRHMLSSERAGERGKGTGERIPYLKKIADSDMMRIYIRSFSHSFIRGVEGSKDESRSNKASKSSKGSYVQHRHTTDVCRYSRTKRKTPSPKRKSTKSAGSNLLPSILLLAINFLCPTRAPSVSCVPKKSCFFFFQISKEDVAS